MILKVTTKKALQNAAIELAKLHSILEDLSDPVFEDDDSALTEAMDEIQNAQDKIEEMLQ